MKFDMHCHIRNGSFDSKVDIRDFIRLLRQRGYGGMLVTDHNTYNGYREWKEIQCRSREYDNFVVLRGIEYDTRDAGHILVIMPVDVELKVMENRGMPLRQLIQTVHSFNGILGPAHPYGAAYLSAMRCRRMKRERELVHEFDFVEGFNACETRESNACAKKLVEEFGKVGFGGSDAHREQDVGLGYTEIAGEIRNNNDLIRAVKNGDVLAWGGVEREKQKNAVLQKSLSIPYRIYNRSLWAAKAIPRHHNLRVLSQRLEIN